jgi:2-hydroxy-3-keto-5-methylthiopentenyl-1-phosphate phosphatase
VTTSDRTQRSVALALDWDGTVTERDTLHMVIEAFGDVGVFEAMERELGRGLTLHEVIACEMATITAPLDTIVAWLLEHVRVRPGLAELVRLYDPLVVSAGFHELIEPVLEREGVRARVAANRLVPGPGGWRAVFRDEVPCAVCGEPCKRRALDGSGPFAYVGDGVSDRCVALAAERVVARDGLARWLEREGVAYEPFETLVDVARALEPAA